MIVTSRLPFLNLTPYRLFSYVYLVIPIRRVVRRGRKEVSREFLVVIVKFFKMDR